MMKEFKSKVYIKIDNKNRIIRCEGGYTISNIKNPDEWILIDEGVGDKYNLCQSHYFAGGLYTEDGISKYRWDGKNVVERTAEEIEADRAALPEVPPTEDEMQWQAITELEQEQLQTDEIAVSLYEQQLTQEEINIAQDEAIVALYEMMEV